VTLPVANGWRSIVWSAEFYRYAGVANAGAANRTMVGIVLTKSSAPLGLEATLSGKIVNLSWNVPSFDGNSAISGYRIERSSSGGPFEELVANTASTATTYADTTAVAGQTYTYRIYAINAQGQGLVSSAVSVQISADASAGMLVDTGISQQVIAICIAALLIVGAVLLKLVPVKQQLTKRRTH